MCQSSILPQLLPIPRICLLASTLPLYLTCAPASIMPPSCLLCASIESHPVFTWQSTLPSSEMPPLRYGLKLDSHRFPLIPFFALSSKDGKDNDCYRRLSYDRPHNTVLTASEHHTPPFSLLLHGRHIVVVISRQVTSKHTPNLQAALVPWHSRVLSVRDKAAACYSTTSS